MKIPAIITTTFLLCMNLHGQNDLDAIRYSNLGVNGTSRFIGLGGAFGAVGADPTCASYNPAGLGLYRKGEISFAFSTRNQNNSATLYNTANRQLNGGLAFNSLGLVVAWKDEKDIDSRHILAFTSNQLQNFSKTIRMTGYTRTSSIAQDMLNLAIVNKSPAYLNYAYEGLGYNTYLLDTFNNQFFSYVDLKRSVKQTRDLNTSGKVNDINFSYAYSNKDQFYFGASLGIPQIRYESTTTHAESDDLDSMRVTVTSPTTYTTTYIDGLPAIWNDKLGFNSLEYKEYFKTTGTGLNLKLGAIFRIGPNFRFGMYYHSSTYYTLTDNYYNSLSVRFDYGTKTPITDKYPGKGGTFSYTLRTPQKYSLNGAYLFGKKGLVSMDYELTDYRSARLSSENVSDFSGANDLIQNKYTVGHNLRLGGELNLKPFLFRAGYAMIGSPFGKVFDGAFVRNQVSAGVGFRTQNNFFIDITWSGTYSREDYYLFTTLNTKASLHYSSSMISITTGIKF